MKIRFLQSVMNRFRMLGVTNGVWLMVHRVLCRLSGDRAHVSRYYLVAQPVSPDDGQAARATTGSVVRQADQRDPLVAEFPRPAEVIARRFEAGSLCYVAEVKGRFAGYLWLAWGAYEEDVVRCRYELCEPKTSAWDYDVYVAPKFRLGRTFVRLWDTANLELASRGMTWTFSRIDAFNTKSMRAHLRMGMQPLFAATFVRLGALQIAFLGVAPFFHMSWRDDRRPVLRLRVPKGD